MKTLNPYFVTEGPRNQEPLHPGTNQRHLVTEKFDQRNAKMFEDNIKDACMSNRGLEVQHLHSYGLPE